MKFDEAKALARAGATPIDNPENVTLTPKSSGMVRYYINAV